MKITITCSACFNQMKIPDDKHIRFRCSDETCKKSYEYKNGKRIKRKFFLPIIALIIFLFGLFESIFFPSTIILGGTFFIWWLFKRSNNYIKRFLSNISLITGIAFSFLFTVQLLLNIFLRPVNLEIPNWLITADNYVLWIRDTLKLWINLSFLFFTLVLVGLVIITYLKPKTKYVSKFLKLDSYIGRVFFICLIITSFTFFSPKVLESVTQDSFFKYYKIAYREKAKQERMQLLADGLIKHLKPEDYRSLVDHNSTFKINYFEPDFNVEDIQRESQEDVRDIMRYSNISKWRLPSINWSEERLTEADIIEKSWNQKNENFNDNLNSSTKTAERSVTEEIINESKKAKIISEEAISALSAVFSKFCGQLSPEMTQLVDQYISSLLETAGEYLFNQSEINNIIVNFFKSNSNGYKRNLFSRLWQWKTNEKDRLDQLEKTRLDLIAEQLEEKRKQESKMRKKQRLLIQEENYLLLQSIENKINNLELKIPLEEKTLYLNAFRPLLGNDISLNKIQGIYQESLIKEIYQNSNYGNNSKANTELKNIERILSTSTSVLSFIGSISKIMPSRFGLCGTCGRPEIAGTPCIPR